LSNCCSSSSPPSPIPSLTLPFSTTIVTPPPPTSPTLPSPPSRCPQHL
jgi:hypothetical protein